MLGQQVQAAAIATDGTAVTQQALPILAPLDEPLGHCLPLVGVCAWGVCITASVEGCRMQAAP